MKVRELTSHQKGVRSFAVDREDKAADDGTAVVDHDGRKLYCHRCGVTDVIYSKCQHTAAMQEILEE